MLVTRGLATHALVTVGLGAGLGIEIEITWKRLEVDGAATTSITLKTITALTDQVSTATMLLSGHARASAMRTAATRLRWQIEAAWAAAGTDVDSQAAVREATADAQKLIERLGAALEQITEG